MLKLLGKAAMAGVYVRLWLERFIQAAAYSSNPMHRPPSSYPMHRTPEPHLTALGLQELLLSILLLHLLPWLLLGRRQATHPSLD